VGSLSARSVAKFGTEPAEALPTPDPSPPRKCVGGGEEEAVPGVPATAASRFATSPLVPFVDFRARCAAASPPERRSQELSGGGCKPVEEPRPLSPRLIAGLSNSAKAGPIGCTSGLDALEFGVFDFAGFFGVSGFFAMAGIWDESARDKRAKAFEGTMLEPPRSIVSRCQHGAKVRKRNRQYAWRRTRGITNRHCEERSDEAIHLAYLTHGLLRFARNDENEASSSLVPTYKTYLQCRAGSLSDA
jgi:hypothetical protein